MVTGVLMFGRDYSIAREVPGYMLGYLEYADGGEAWTYRLAIGTGERPGNLFEFFIQISSRISVSFRRPFELEDVLRRDDAELMMAAREVMVNNIAHTTATVERCT